ncbi:sodium-dependent transporter [Flavobacterium sp. ACAM 123]|jgi:SNF family Na+-dependent transporter|uniref:sodium-dependent transporter n=1 Tax=Flavobacterium sp. ACAM 123 TaxID=1189620 RepID=UPI0002F3D2E9|nr:sodium-dependent transporter [Flavobacterium sp. ACAM 123]
MSVKVDSWGSRVGLILAMAGNAVGLGNFLRFPVQAIENGGGAFIIPYLICFLVMGIPLLFIEWSSGRYGGKFGNHSTPYILDSMVKGRLLKYIGVFGIFTNIAIASYYCYIESWTMSYVYHTLIGTFNGMSQANVAGFFDSYTDISHSTTGLPYEAVIFYVICLILNTFILSKGIKGIEKVAKVGMPLLILFGVLLAVRGLTLGTSGASEIFPDANAWDGLNFLWTPQYDSILDLKVWMAAAGQIFFTLSVGMGTIHCYAAYIDEKDDIALNAVSTGFMNEFVEVVLGSLIVIPIAAGYLGLDWVIENAGFGMAFQTMPFLFEQWGSTLAVVAGVCWFGLLFFAGITSSLAMGTPWMGFMRDEFGWSKNKGAWSFGAMILVLGLPTVIFFKEGVFDEYDYWAGTVSLVVFAMFETILFSWIFGMDKGWREITSGADIKVPNIYKFIIKFVTPVLLIIIFLGSLFKPLGNNWSGNVSSFFSGNGWPLDNGSIIKMLTHAGIRDQIALATDPAIIEQLQDKILYLNFARLMLVGLFMFISSLVYFAFLKRRREGRATV